MNEQVQRKAFAKINLSIDVLRKRSDGYHDVCMVMQQVNLFDVITIVRDRTISGLSLIVHSRAGEIPADESNLAHRAAHLMKTRYPDAIPDGVRMELEKNIPIAAGLAGGSADAAAVFLGMNELWSLSLSPETLMELGAELGADVPFCVMGQLAVQDRFSSQSGALSTCALAEGIGEKLTPLPPFKGWVILAKPPVPVSTALVYRTLKIDDIQRRPDTEDLIRGLSTNEFNQIKGGMYNVLQEVSAKIEPAVQTLLDEIGQIVREQSLGDDVHTMMSGSGPTVFVIATKKEPLLSLFQSLKGRQIDTFLVELL